MHGRHVEFQPRRGRVALTALLSIGQGAVVVMAAITSGLFDDELLRWFVGVAVGLYALFAVGQAARAVRRAAVSEPAVSVHDDVVQLHVLGFKGRISGQDITRADLEGRGYWWVFWNPAPSAPCLTTASGSSSRTRLREGLSATVAS
ncbi:MAG: hypothetical protein RIE08_06085 [Acidimicrobiales bacterium]